MTTHTPATCYTTLQWHQHYTLWSERHTQQYYVTGTRRTWKCVTTECEDSSECTQRASHSCTCAHSATDVNSREYSNVVTTKNMLSTARQETRRLHAWPWVEEEESRRHICPSLRHKYTHIHVATPYATHYR